MKENLGMFKAYDIRAKEQTISPERRAALVRAVVRYYTEELGTERVILARDARLHGPKLLEALSEAFLSSGVDVVVNPLQISTCQFYYMCMQDRAAGGIMVTASHNPSEYIGLKLVGPGCFPIASGSGPGGGIDDIRKLYIEDRPLERKARGRLSVSSQQEGFVDYSLALSGVKEGSLSGLRVYAEFLSGSAGMDFLLAFSKAGAEVECSHFVPDGFFPSGDPNPIIESSVAPARERMREGCYDIGFVFDGDGDRLDLMYPDGSQVLPSLNMALVFPYLRPVYSGSFSTFRSFADMKTTPAALSELRAAGLEPSVVRSGHSVIKGQLTRHAADGYVVAQEETAHYYLNLPVAGGFIASENTLLVALLSARAMKERPEGYERAKRIQEGIYRAREWSLHCIDSSVVGKVLSEVRAFFLDKGAVLTEEMEDGTSLAATIMRLNDGSAWCQIAQHSSNSEDSVARWEVSASSAGLCSKAEAEVRSFAEPYIKAGLAEY